MKPLLSTAYLAFNTSRGIFKDNVPLRKAVNQAIDRRALLAQGGYLAGKRTDQILPPGMAGFRDADLYPLKQPNMNAAKKLAQRAYGQRPRSCCTSRTAARHRSARRSSSTT